MDKEQMTEEQAIAFGESGAWQTLSAAVEDTVKQRPWWFPVRTDAAWCEHVRKDLPEDTEGLSDEAIRDLYADGRKYDAMRDHLGDAYGEYKELADAYLNLLAWTEARGDRGGVRREDVVQYLRDEAEQGHPTYHPKQLAPRILRLIADYLESN